MSEKYKNFLTKIGSIKVDFLAGMQLQRQLWVMTSSTPCPCHSMEPRTTCTKNTILDHAAACTVLVILKYQNHFSFNNSVVILNWKLKNVSNVSSCYLHSKVLFYKSCNLCIELYMIFQSMSISIDNKVIVIFDKKAKPLWDKNYQKTELSI